MKRHSAATVSYITAARKSIDITNEESGFQRMEDSNDSSVRRAGIRLDVNDKRVENGVEDWDGAHSMSLLVEDGNANFNNLDTSSLQVSLQSEDQERKETGAEYTTLNESFDSAL